MSDDKNLDPNHFCAPVDEFEKFQADSMYEEEDFITLSDIVPPQPPVPDLSNELLEIPYDNEVILSSTQNDIQQCGISAEDHTLENKSLAQALDTAGNGAETLDSTSTSKAPARSGRKRGVKRNQKFREKQTYNNSEKHEEESLNKNYLGVQDSVHSTTADKTDTESRLDTSSATNIPRRTSRERIPNTVRYPLVTETQLSQVNPVKRRPGRPKKIHAENQSNSEPDSTNPENNSISNDSSNTPECSGLHLHNTAKTCDLENGSYKLTNINNSVTTESESDISSKDVNKDTKKRRGRKKKVVASVPINKDEDLETLNGDKILPESSQNSQLSDSIKHIPNETTDSSKKVIDTGSLIKAEESFIEQDNIDVENDNDADDICLSKLKQSFDTSINTDNITTNIVQNENNECKNDNTSKRASKVSGKEDFKYNIEDVIKETSKTDQLNLLENDVNESLLIEDISKRPIRRKVKQTFKYDSESEEDPYANVELSDDDGEPKSRKKGRYYSDDEYVPGGRRGKPSSSSSDSDIELDDEDLEGKKRRKKITKNTDSQTPKKRGRKRILEKETESDVNVINVEDKALEESSKPSLTVTDETLSMKPPAEAWATSNEFENFIAKKIQGTSVKIQKVTSKTKTQSTPLEIPVLDQNEPKKTVVKSTQTTNNPTTSTGIQTSVPYDIPMKNNINLTSEQSEKACEFLNSVVKTTSELGQLMKDKSEDFMKKKINTGHVTDTFKMDYCVRKSFLLFKLARHNLMQMEEDLAKQYDEFLKNNDLSSCREEVKNIIPKPKSNPKADSDSDCEIVEVKESSKTPKKSEKPKFNAKTVFLNKELSIKIAKKPSAEKKLNIEGRQYVWINDSVMVKKVKPTQSFLAQDSRNKKPPDSVYNITEKIVSDFFDNYYRQKALTVCAPFVTTEWSSLRKEYACHYFVASENLEGANRVRNNEANLNNIENSASTSIENYDYVLMHDIPRTVNPKSLTTLCVEVVRNNMCHLNLSKTEEESEKKQPLSLFRLCYKNISQGLQVNKKNNKNIDNTAMTSIIPSLKTLCYRSITSLLFDAMGKGSFTSLEEDITEDNEHINEWRQDDVRSEESDSYEDLCAFISNEIVSKETHKAMYSSGHTTGNTKLLCHLNNVNPSQEKNILNGIKSLSSLCLNSIQLLLKNTNSCITPLQPEFQSPKTLKYLAYESIRHIICDNKIIVSIDEHSPISNEEPIFESESGKDFAINCINTLTEEAFSNLQETDELRDDDDDYYEPDTGFDGDHEDENEWASQVQMQELRSCVTPIENTNINENGNAAIDNSGILAYNFAECELDGLNNINDDQYQDQCRETLQDGPVCDSLTPQIKQEPLDEIPESQLDSSVVKTEPIHGFHGMTIIPESIVTKSEMTEDIEPDVVSNSEPINTTFDRDSFEHFVRANKMVRSMDEFSDDDFNNIFSQSASRVRREHEPDPEAGTDMNMGLLVPQTYEPLPVETVKDSLMESSSDDGKDNTTKKASKKKTDKKARGKLKKGKDLTKNGNKETTIKEVTTPVKVATLVKEKQQCSTEIAILTRRMREKIRQEEKKVESSESESENAPLSTQKGKNKKGLEKSSTQIEISKHVEEPSNHKKDMNIEIQCNSVDSTAQIIEKDDMDRNKFSGFSAIDQNEITTYQKYMKFVYERIIPQDEEKNNSVTSANVNPNLESNQTRSDSPVITPDQPVEILECEPTLPLCLQDGKTNTVSKPKKAGRKKEKEQEILDINKSTFTEQDGWHCYPINSNDKKLYSYCEIPLRKLPESFVETYLEYHDITERDNHDKEVDRLVNLNTLNRSSVKSKKRLKDKKSGSESVSLSNSRNVSRSASPANSEHYDELTPSEDESPNIEDEIPPSVAVRATENSMAKNSLMDDHESDSDSGTPNKSKNIEDEQQPPQIQEKRKCGPKSKTKIDKPKELPTSESVMLTADKMMNKELTLLHAPVTLKQELNDNPIVKEPSPKDDSKMRTTRSKRKELKKTLKTEDDSSSEEEKQWVSTKEKLLKRLGKKEDVSVDDAKRAKLVTDFIEKHGGAPGKRRAAVTGGRRSRRKRLEQQKQLRVLSKELFGEPTGGKRGAVKGLFTGRRNIRKVIDKKSLQRSTVLANMEEFERKRRLNARQTMLRELHGCEEGVNVLVINDEVCLEYDFNEHRPVVTVHPFFTKVMKAHQYEGVKFMWDACFESLSCIEAGHAGGGCILAHCMGLGKTLQVLALLHTVLTHPRVGMQRVLVCCPLSTVLNWVDEIHKWIGPVTDQIKVFELSKLKKTYERAYQLEDWYNGGGIFIIGYELFRSLTTLDPVIDDVRITIINKIRTALLDPGPDIIICDEGHLLKNDCSVLAVAMSRVVTKRRIILTGTPMQNNLREYYCMVNFVKPDLLGTYSEYSNRFENPIMNGQHRDSQEEDIKLMKARTHILHKVLEGCLQRQEASVLYPYLPKKHEYTVFIPLTKCQWDLYKHYVHHYTKKSKQSVLKDFHILQKIWSHPQVLHNFQIKARDNAKKKDVKLEKVEDDLALEDNEDLKPPDTETWWLQYVADGAMLNTLESSNKFIAVFRILNECISLGDKVLIFSTSLFCLDALEYFLQTMNGWSLGQEYYRLDGSVPPEVRQKWCREFNAENNVKTKLFLISTRAGCLGLNMTAANRVIILDTSWNPAHDIQSIFRVYRFGQKKDCYIYRLVAMGTMEQKIYERAVTKQAVACRVVDEQQIDRHYNMAELTELYRFDEAGASVAGGVAVGVSDVALLRVARDEPRAVHAVHEHDSLLRGSAEPNLPEHERAAAWTQFQQEHAHRQMQNDLDANKAALAQQKVEERLKREEERLKKVEERQQSQVHKIKTEEGPIHDPSLIPQPGDLTVKDPQKEPMRGKKYNVRGRGKKGKTVQCRIPIKKNQERAGPSQEEVEPILEHDDDVREITNLLIKYNFTKPSTGAQEICELVASVKKMVQTGKPVNLGKGSDELTASIASVLMKRQASLKRSEDAPPAVDVSPEPVQQRPKPKSWQANLPDTPLPIEETGRPRRLAAISAEKSFEKASELNDDMSQDSEPNTDDVIQLDDDWIASDTDSVPETPIRKPPSPVKKFQGCKPGPKSKKKALLDDSSIVLSDDETPSTPATSDATPASKLLEKLYPNIPISRKSNAGKVAEEKPTIGKLKEALEKPVTAPTVKTDPGAKEEPVALHPSLLTNQNFIMLVAHTYLAGNPMLDEDAATLAAQYSTFKALKEFQTTGKPIDSGPIYDIAIQVFGKENMKKLHEKAHPISSSTSDNVTIPKLLQNLGQQKPAAGDENHTAPSAPVANKLIGPKSRVTKNNVVQAPEVPKSQQQQMPSVVPIGLVRTSDPPTASPAPREECILPDDEVECVTPPVDRFKLKPKSLSSLKPIVAEQKTVKFFKLVKPQSAPVRVSAGASASASYATICLDSDEEDAPAAAPAPPVAPTPAFTSHVRSHTLQIPKYPSAAGAGPVPVALTGPNSQPIPLTLTTPPARAPPPAPPPRPEPVPVSLVGPDARFVPITLAGPGFQSYPISMTGPDGRQTSIASGRPGIVVSVPSAMPASPAPAPAPSAPVIVRVPTSQPAGSVAEHLSNIYLVPMSRSEPVSVSGGLTRLTAAQVPTAVRVQASQVQVPGGAPSNRTYLQPGMRLQLDRHGRAVLLPADEIHVIPDETTAPLATTSTAPAAKPSHVAAASALAKTAAPVRPQTSNPSARQPPPKAPTPPQTKSPDRIRKVSSSSSGDSDSSRAASPSDPLSILKDVVHIQAPERRQPRSTAADRNKPPVKTTRLTTNKSVPNNLTETTLVDIRKTDISEKLSKIIASVKKRVSESASVAVPGKTIVKIKPPVNAKQSQGQIKDTVDLTDQPSKAGVVKAASQRAGKSAQITKKDVRATVVGTSKNIILDGKSKSLTNMSLVDLTGQNKNVNVTNVKTINIKAEKRAAPPPEIRSKKKKTELMTLKDFDIDDIDDIIELD